MFSPFRSPALRARRPAHPPRRAGPPVGLGEIEAAVAAAIPVPAVPPASSQQQGEIPDGQPHFHGSGGGGGYL